MIIAVGSTNIVKIHAVEEVLKTYSQLEHSKVFSFAVPSEISEQPFSLEETILGSKNRARNAFSACKACHYSFGIESGLFEAKGSMTGYLEACICCIYDGKNYHVGMSCGFEIPPHILALVLNNKRDLGQACHESGITSNPKLGSAEGLIGILSNGRINRKEYTKQCIRTALIQIEHSNLYCENTSC